MLAYRKTACHLLLQTTSRFILPTALRINCRHQARESALFYSFTLRPTAKKYSSFSFTLLPVIFSRACA